MPKTNNLNDFEIVSRSHRKNKYDYESLSEIGGYFEVSKNDREAALNSCYVYIGRRALGYHIHLAKKDGKYVIVRTA
jgi:hypothetical protein